MGMSNRFGLIAFVLIFTTAILARPAAPKKTTANRQLQNCWRIADYVGRGKVASCKTTAELGATASISFANSFSSCIEHLDRLITTNRDTCQKKYSK